MEAVTEIGTQDAPIDVCLLFRDVFQQCTELCVEHFPPHPPPPPHPHLLHLLRFLLFVPPLHWSHRRRQDKISSFVNVT